ncbi:MAG: hypothetical protein ACFE9L_07980 [Candidatus Hodarchaeota archaeon]
MSLRVKIFHCYLFIFVLFLFTSIYIVSSNPSFVSQPPTTWQWSTPEVVSTVADANSREPSIAIDTSGNIHVVWEDFSNYMSSGYQWDIFYRQWVRSSQSWSPTEVVSNTTTAGADSPQIAVDSQGTVHVVWRDNTDYFKAGSDFDIIHSKRSSMTNEWSTKALISIFSTEDSATPDVTVDPSDNVHIIWMDETDDYISNGADKDIFYRMWNATSSNWGSVELISSESDAGSYYPSIEADQFNNLHVVYSDESNIQGSGNDSDIIYKHYDANLRTWSTPVVVSYNSSNTRISHVPVVKTSPEGTPHIVWVDASDINGAGIDWDIFHSRFVPSTGTWSSAYVVSSESSTTSDYPDFTFDALGNLYVCWTDMVNYGGAGDDSDVFFKYWNITDETWGPLSLVSTGSNAFSSSPSIVLDSYNFIHIMWEDRTDDWLDSGDDDDIFYKTLSGSPTAPKLNLISPNPSSDGVVSLYWSDSYAAEYYNVYRHSSLITSTTSLSPIAFVQTTQYTDNLNTTGTYYYAIVAENPMGSSPVSNSESVNVSLATSESNPGFEGYLLLLGLIPLIVVKIRRRR